MKGKEKSKRELKEGRMRARESVKDLSVADSERSSSYFLKFDESRIVLSESNNESLRKSHPRGVREKRSGDIVIERRECARHGYE